MALTFSKEERLCSQKTIDRLYADGHRLMAFPYNIIWLETPDLDIPCQLLIVVPKRRLHHAVDRNRMKRLSRECYRQLKPRFYSTLQERGMHITLALVYIHNELLPYEKIFQKMEKLIAQLVKEISNGKDLPPAE